MSRHKIDPPSLDYGVVGPPSPDASPARTSGAASNRGKKSWKARVKRFLARKPAAMRIDLYATCWNEESMIPFFLRHYEPIADRIIVFDDGSTDRSRELLAASSKVELRRLRKGASSILMHMEELNHSWKESRGRADWVFICDIDEHLYHHKSLRGYLEQCKAEGATIINPVGVDMVSARFPSQDILLSETIRTGVRSFLLDKKAVFDPNAIEEINYTPGRHVASPVGRLIFPPKREVKILHYRHLSLDSVIARSRELSARRTEFDRERGWGNHDCRSTGEIRRDFEKMLGEAVDISLIGKKPAATDQRKL